MLFFYSLLLYLSTPLFLLRLWLKGRKLPAYRQQILSRFALRLPQRKVEVWIHAVSLGEVITIIPLIEGLLAKNHTVLLTTMTPTGMQKVQKTFGKRLCYQYLPYDLPFAIKRFYANYRPKLGLITETEIWPNLIHIATKQKIPLLLINARLSQQSVKNYQQLKWFFKPRLDELQHIFVQSSEDRQRFLKLGIGENKVSLMVNMKFHHETGQEQKIFDLNIRPLTQAGSIDEGQEEAELRAAIDIPAQDFNPAPQMQFATEGEFEKRSKNRVILIVASTHEAEEEQIFFHFNQLKNAIPNILLLIAPRHPQRFLSVYQLAQSYGFKTTLRSQTSLITPEIEVLLIDSVGELKLFYAHSDYAFVGGSLVPKGGHNILEPINLKIPTFCGPHMQNFASISQLFTQGGGFVQVKNAHELIEKIIFYHQHPREKQKLIAKAQEILAQNPSPINKYLAIIEEILG